MQVQILNRIYKRMLSFLSKHLPIPIRHNALYAIKDVLEPVIRAQAENTFVESAARRLNRISADDVFYHLNKMSVSDVKETMYRGIESSFLDTRKQYRITCKVDIAVDVHEIPYYGEGNNIWIQGGKHKNGTNNFIKIISLCIVSKGKRYTLAVIPFNMFDLVVYLLEQLILVAKRYMKIQRIFLDRGFLSVGSINKLYELGMQFIIPIKRDSRARKAMKECFLQGNESVNYTIKSSDGKESTFDLVVYQTEDDLVGFATNIKGSSERMANLYRKRWGIETSYRVKNVFYGKTCSRRISVRILFILLSFMLYNLWVLANRMLDEKFPGQHVTAGDMCIEFVRFIEQGVS